MRIVIPLFVAIAVVAVVTAVLIAAVFVVAGVAGVAVAALLIEDLVEEAVVHIDLVILLALVFLTTRLYEQ